MDIYHCESLKLISRNTENDALIYFFYGDIYSQDALLRNAKRVHYQVWANEFVNSLQERKIKRHYYTELPGDSGGGLVTRESFFQFGNAGKSKPAEFFEGVHDICKFDYYVFDKASSQQALAQYNLLLASGSFDSYYIYIQVLKKLEYIILQSIQ